MKLSITLSLIWFITAELTEELTCRLDESISVSSKITHRTFQSDLEADTLKLAAGSRSDTASKTESVSETAFLQKCLNIHSLSFLNKYVVNYTDLLPTVIKILSEIVPALCTGSVRDARGSGLQPVLDTLIES